MRMRQYICHTDHNLWDVIVNEDLEEEHAPTIGETSAPPAPKTAKQLAARRNQEREAIKLRFGGNVESKKMQKNVIKHQFENFSTASNESLDKAYDRFQKLISQLEVHGAPISKEDINQKFLRSLPSSWNQIALIMRNNPDIDEIDIDDLYNNRRVYKDELKSSSGSNSASQNLAFLSSENTGNTNEVSTASRDFRVSTAGGINQVPSTSCTHDVAYSFLAQPTTSSQLENKDFQHMDGDDLEELDLRWQVAMLTVRVRKFIQRTRRNMDFKEKRHVSLDKLKIECYNCHRKWHFARECRSRRNQGRRSYGDYGRSNAPTTESSSQALVAQDGLGSYDWSNDFEVEPVNYALMAISSSSSSSSSDRVLIRTGFVSTNRPSISTARPVCTTRPSISTARPVCIARSVYATRPIYLRMDDVRPRGSCSPIKRSYYTKPAFRPKDLKQDVKTFGVKNMTTAGKRALVNTGKGKLDTDLKKSIWVWRPKGNYLDHVSKDSRSFMLKKVEYVDPKWISKSDHAVVDSGCSSHMTGNKAYLSDYEDFNGGFVAFGSDPKGDKLKFNLFSVSQMCDKKNSVLFTESECLILSPSLKLLVKSQVVLRAPRKDDVYNLDLKNIVPSGDVIMGQSLRNKWVWRPKMNYQDHVYKYNGSYMLKKFEAIPESCLQDHAWWIVVCSMPYDWQQSLSFRLQRFQLGGFVAFGSDPKGGKITDKGKIKTANLDFDDVYFVDELNFKLLDESQVVLRAPRKDVLRLDLKNIVPFGGKFEGKSDEVNLLGYSTSNKAFRVYNKRTKRVEENLHINFLEDQPNVAGTGPNWMFDLDFLTTSMNYIPVSVENQDDVHGCTRQPSEKLSPDKGIQVSEDVFDKEGQHQMPEDEQVLQDELEMNVTHELVVNANE
ncbi:ribonuclease H-like domain-containing protein [Tanacetum coccineum]